MAAIPTNKVIDPEIDPGTPSGNQPDEPLPGGITAQRASRYGRAGLEQEISREKPQDVVVSPQHYNKTLQVPRLILYMLAFMAAFLTLPSTAQERPETSSEEKTRLAPKGFEALPDLKGKWQVAPCFLPMAAQSGLLMLGSLGESESSSGKELRLILHQLDLAQNWQHRELGSAGDLSLAKTQSASLSVVPDPSKNGLWSLALSGLEGKPRAWLPAPTARFIPYYHAMEGARGPFVSDLDRDGSLEYWFMSPKAALPNIVQVSLDSRQRAKLIEESWHSELSAALRILAFDLDEDNFEEILVLRQDAELRFLHNEGGLELEAFADELQPRNAAGNVLQSTNFVLGPQREELQWAFAFGGNEKEPALLYRKEKELEFKALLNLPEALLNLRPLDARIQDMDADGAEELIVLATKASKKNKKASKTPYLFIFELSKSPSRAALLRGEPLRIKDGRAILLGDLDGDGAPDLVIDRGLVSPLCFKNTAYLGGGARSFSVTLKGNENWPHAIGSYVSLYSGDKRLLRMRWPPLAQRDQTMLWLSWGREGLDEEPHIQVTWPDGNAQEIEGKAGAYLKIER